MSSRKTITTILDIMKHMSVRIDLMSPADWPEVCSILQVRFAEPSISDRHAFARRIRGSRTAVGSFREKAPVEHVSVLGSPFSAVWFIEEKSRKRA